MRSGNTCRKGEAKGGGVGCLVVVILIVGGLFLYQREGGKIFGPGGVIAPPPPPRVTVLKATFDTGLFSHDLLLTNGSARELKDVDLTITLFREDGEKPVVKQFWSKWSVGEVKKINVPSHNYQKVTLTGRAFQDPEWKKIDDGWTWTWK